jgi:hypothetical protein
MATIYRLGDYRNPSVKTLATTVREGKEYWRAREEAVHLISALQRLGNELADLEDILEQGDRHPSYGTWEGNLESFLHMVEYERRICREQMDAVSEAAKENLFVIEMLRALRADSTVWWLNSLDGDGRNGQESLG